MSTLQAAANDGTLLAEIKYANSQADDNEAVNAMFLEGGESAVVGATKYVVTDVMASAYQAVYDPKK